VRRIADLGSLRARAHEYTVMRNIQQRLGPTQRVRNRATQSSEQILHSTSWLSDHRCSRTNCTNRVCSRVKKSSAMMPILCSWVRFFMRAEGKHTQFNHVKDQQLLHKQRSAHLLWRPKGGPRTSHEYFKLESARSFKNVDNNTRSSETENRTRQQRCSCSRLPCGTSRLHVCDLNANGPILHFIFEPVSL